MRGLRSLFPLLATTLFALLFLAGCGPVSPKEPAPAARVQEAPVFTYGYPAGYEVKPIDEQIGILREAFPELDTNQGFAPVAIRIPEGAEGLFAIPQWQAIAPTLNEAVERVFVELAHQRSFDNWITGRLGPEYLRETERSATMWWAPSVKAQMCWPAIVVWARFGRGNSWPFSGPARTAR